MAESYAQNGAPYMKNYPSPVAQPIEPWLDEQGRQGAPPLTPCGMSASRNQALIGLAGSVFLAGSATYDATEKMTTLTINAGTIAPGGVSSANAINILSAGVGDAVTGLGSPGNGVITDAESNLLSNGNVSDVGANYEVAAIGLDVIAIGPKATNKDRGFSAVSYASALQPESLFALIRSQLVAVYYESRGNAQNFVLAVGRDMPARGASTNSGGVVLPQLFPLRRGITIKGGNLTQLPQQVLYVYAANSLETKFADNGLLLTADTPTDIVIEARWQFGGLWIGTRRD